MELKDILPILFENTFHLYILAAALLFSPVWEKRENFKLRCILCLGAYMVVPFFGLYGISWLKIGVINLIYVILFFAMLLALWGCFKLSFAELAFFGITSFTLQHTADCLGRIVAVWFAPLFGIDINALQGGNFYIWVTLNISQFLFFIAINIIAYFVLVKKLMKGKEIHIKKKSLLVLLAATIILVYVLALYTAQKISLWPYTKPYGLACCILILCLQFSLFEKSKAQQEMETMEKILLLNGVHHASSKESIEIINRKCHDLKHQIRMIRKSEGTVDKTYLKELEKTIVMYDSLTKTGNAALDVILSEKKLLCEEYGITLACIVDGKALNFMSDVDIYSLFGNILDNAMQAVDKLEHPEEKIINLNVITQNGFISIHQDNRYVGELIFQDGLPLTTNADKVEHGFGMSSMRYIVNKYNGSIATLAAQGIFEINILLQIKN